MEFINIILIIWLLIIVLIIFQQLKAKDMNIKEGFTPRIRGFYNPHLRNIRMFTESFMNQYNENYFVKMLKNVGIY